MTLRTRIVLWIRCNRFSMWMHRWRNWHRIISGGRTFWHFWLWAVRVEVKRMPNKRFLP